MALLTTSIERIEKSRSGTRFTVFIVDLTAQAISADDHFILPGVPEVFRPTLIEWEISTADGVSTLQPRLAVSDNWGAGDIDYLDQVDTAAAAGRNQIDLRAATETYELWCRPTPDTSSSGSAFVGKLRITVAHGH